MTLMKMLLLSFLLSTLHKVSHYRGAKVWNKSTSRDVEPSPAHSKGRWGSSFLRSRWKLHQGIGVVQKKDAALLSGTDYNRQVHKKINFIWIPFTNFCFCFDCREESQLFCDARGEWNFYEKIGRKRYFRHSSTLLFWNDKRFSSHISYPSRILTSLIP